MRFDITGLFWDDYVAPRVPVEKIKRTPPDPTWLADDYLPDLEQAKAFKFDLMADSELVQAASDRHRLVWDNEFYPNYSLLGFKDIETKKIIKFEMHQGELLPERDKFLWIMKNFTLIGFNDTKFDIPMAHAALDYRTPEMLSVCSNDIINGGEYLNGISPSEFYKSYKIKPFHVDHIDLIELTPLSPGLKKIAGRLHAPRMADLPFPPTKNLLADQKTIVRWYWSNDLQNTELDYYANKKAIELRELLTKEYKVDVRSSSDPQIAEAVIRSEVKRISGRKFINKAVLRVGHKFRFQPASYLQFNTPLMRDVLGFIRVQDFEIDPWGSPTMPEALAGLDINIGSSTYRMGIGGLHSQEKRQIHFSDEEYELSDNDVTSYYPSLIIQQGMYPPHVGPEFLIVFKRIYDRRIAAKREGARLVKLGQLKEAMYYLAEAETLKIVLNGTFGKTGERGGHSVVYYPEMMIQVTLSGQLALLMLIEALELAGISVVSANTDGIVIKCPRHLIDTKAAIVAWWEKQAGLGLESVPYKAIYSRDVNNYIALYEKPKGDDVAKRIGAYRHITDGYPLKWNPTCDICADAVTAYLATGKPIEQTVFECDDFRLFIEVRFAAGGAVKNGEFLGKMIRWYYAEGEKAEIINAKSGHIIPRSLGGKPCMMLPDKMPEDLDRQYYIDRAYGILADFEPKKKKEKEVA